MAFTQLDVSNKALDMIGAKTVSVLSLSTPEYYSANGEACLRNFDSALEQVIRAAPWTFAKARATLGSAAAPAFGWTNAFDLPSDFVSLLEVNGAQGQLGNLWEIENGQLLGNFDTAEIQYIRQPNAGDQNGANVFLALADAFFIQALATLLAVKIAPVLRQDGQEAATALLQRYEQTDLPRAIRYNASLRSGVGQNNEVQSLYNEAIDMVGVPAGLPDGPQVALEACRRSVVPALNEILRVNQWNFALFRTSLDETDAPAFGWAHAYTLPIDFISLVKLNGTEVSNQPGEFFEVENGLLLTDEDHADVQYIRGLGGALDLAGLVGLADPLFRVALATLIAAKIAPTLYPGDGLQIAQNLYAVYAQRVLPTARRYDGSEGKPRRYDPASESNFIRARYIRVR